MLEDTYVRTGKVAYVVDGDTFDLDVDLGFFVTVRIRIRVLGIDAPEIHGITKVKGLVSKQFVTDNILGKEIAIVSRKQDSFRRWLADVYYKDAEGKQYSLSEELFRNGLAIMKIY